MPLAEVVFPQQITELPPIFSPSVRSAISSVLDEWTHVDEMISVGVSPSKSCLIYGDPGTGKTRLAYSMARSLNLPVVSARLDSLMSSFLGTTSRNIGNLFAFANRYSCVLLLDEFDAIAKIRDDPQEVGEIKRVVNTLLQNLDGRRETGFTLGLTNHPKLLDPAIWRRFDVQLEVPRPDMTVRIEIVRRFMAPVKATESHIRLLAWFTEGASGSEIEMLVRAYKKAAVIGGEGDLIGTLRQFATLNAGRISDDRKQSLLGDVSNFLRRLKGDQDTAFSLAELGEIVGKDKSTISRLLGKA